MITFSEDMDNSGSNDPVISFPVEDPSASLSFSAGIWNSLTEYAATYTVTDADQDLADVDVRVTAAQDALGNILATHDEADNFSIDMAAPTITITTPVATDDFINFIEESSVFVNGTTTAEDGQTVTVTFDDGGSTVVASPIAGSGAWTANFVNVSGLAEGNITITADVTDVAGNPATQASTVVVKDTELPTLPTVSIASDNSFDANQASPGQVITLSFTASEDINIPTVTIFGNIAAINDLSDADETTWQAAYVTAGTDAEGTVPFSIDFSDLASNAGTQVTAITAGGDVNFDKTPPTTPTVNVLVTNNDNPLVSGTFDAASGSVIVEVSIDGGANFFTANQTTSDWDFTFTGVADGTYDVIARTEDAAGNQVSDATTNELTVDTSNPSITSGSATPSIEEPSTTVETYTADEAVTWSLSGTDASLFSINTSGDLSFNSAPDFETPGDAGGDNGYDLTVTATDVAGNVVNLVVLVTVTDLDEIDPVITSGSGTPSVAENVTTVETYTADEAVAWSLSGTDASLFSINTSGDLSFLSPPDFEVPGDAGGDNTYDLTVTATDGTGNFVDLVVAVAVTDVDEIDPVITSGGATPTVVENVTIVETYTADEAVTWSLSGTDASLFTINTGGDLTFNVAPDFEVPGDSGGDNGYDLTVTATDGAGNVANLVVLVTVTDLDEIDPVITSGSATPSVIENVTTVETYTADEAVTWSLSGTDASLFSINTSGDLSFISAPDFEVPGDAGGDNGYDLTVTATDGTGNFVDLVVAVTVTDVDEIDPIITSGSASPSVAENTIEVETYTADEAVTWSVSGTDASLFSINTSGDLSFISAPDFEVPGDAGGDNTYDLTLTATDGTGNFVDLVVAITVTDVDEIDPVITSGSASPSISENTTTVETYTTDETVTWSVSGTDASLFTINTGGDLTFNGAPDFEVPGDSGGDNIYDLTVTATDGGGNTADLVVAVTVTDVDELVPTPVITSVSGSPTNVNPFSIQVDFGEVVTGFTAIDVAPTNGALSNFVNVDGQTYTFDITPLLSETTVNVSIPAAAAADGAGNDNTAADLDIIFDEVVPTVAVNSLTTADTTPELTGTVNDNTATISVTVDGTAYTATNNGDGTWTLFDNTVTGLAEATYDVVATATDAAGNVGTDGTTDELVVDATAPLITVDALTTSDTTPELTGTIDDNTATISVSVDGTAYSATNNGDGTWTLVDNTVAALAEATYDVVATATDAAGNAGTDATTNQLIIDTSGPSITSGSDTPSIAENTTAVETYVADETVSWSMTGTDGLLFDIDGGTGVLIFNTAPDFENPGDADGDNVYEIEITATDGSGNETNLPVTVTVTDADEIAPVISGNFTPSVEENITTGETYTADEAVTWTVTSGADASLFTIASDGLVSFTSAPDFESPSDADGDNVYEVTITATDAAGNASDEALTITVTDVDEIAPVISGDLTPSVAENNTTVATYTADETVTWSVTSGADASLFAIASDGTVSFSTAPDFEAPSDSDGDNVYEVTITAIDALANASDASLTITVTDEDEVAPTITVNSLSTNEASPELSGTVDDNDATIEVTIGTDTYTATNNGDGTWTLAGGTIVALTDGTYEVIATARDLAGNVGTDATTDELIVDTTAPTVTVTALTTSIVSPELNGTYIEANGVASITVTIDGTDYTGTDNGDGTWTLPAGTLADLAGGTYDVLVTITDTFGNTGADASTDELTIDQSTATTPVITINTTESLDRSPELTGTVDDNDAEIKVTVEGTEYGATNNEDGTWTLAANTFPELNVGTYDIIAIATNLSNLTGTDATTDELRILPAATTALAATDITTGSFTANWSAQDGGAQTYLLDVSEDENFSFTFSIYGDFDTEGELSEVISSLDYNTRFYYRVRVQYTSGDISDYSNTVTVLTATDPGTSRDSLALVAIYNATDGANWERNNNWLTGRLRTWENLSVDATRVTGINLSNNNLHGTIAPLTTGLGEVTSLDLSNNELQGVGGLTSMSSLETLDVSGNFIQFGDLENLVGAATNVNYDNQGIVLEEVRALQEIGTSYTVDRTITGSSNTYEWYEVDEVTGAETLITDLNGVSVSGNSFTIPSIEEDDERILLVKVTNTLVTGLELTSARLFLRVSSLARDSQALLNILEATGGNDGDWSPTQAWTGDVQNWSGVEVENSRVVGLNLSAAQFRAGQLTGELPGDILDIANLRTVNLANNALTKIPDMTRLPNLETLNVDRNALQPGDLEPHINITTFTYSNQAKFGPENVNEAIGKGSNYTIDLRVTGTANEYQWEYKGPATLDTIKVDDATAGTIDINDINYENMGAYKLTVENLLLPTLGEYESHPQVINATTSVMFTPTYIDTQTEETLNLTEGTADLLQILKTQMRFDSVGTTTVGADGFAFTDVVLGDYLIGVKAENVPDLLPTYYRSEFLWEQADTLFLRDVVSEALTMQQNPPDLPILPNGGVVNMEVVSDFAEDGEDENGNRIEARRKVKRAGCSLRRRRRASGGRPENDDEEFELVVYKETDDNGQVTFENLPDDTYFLNIEYPGIPMDPSTTIEFTVGAGGIEDNEFTLEAVVTEDGIAVELIEALGFYRQYFKDLDIYPNPADKYLNIRYEKLMSDQVKVQILNLEGRVMHEEDVRKGFNQEMQLEVDLLDPGMYLVRFYDPESPAPTIITYRVMISR
ncbi:MAG: Ig-like domain-containing protein [Cytophagales bacterium]|nr:Ig-like domain-containing protein [Cytophagales bacterium]